MNCDIKHSENIADTILLILFHRECAKIGWFGCRHLNCVCVEQGELPMLVVLTVPGTMSENTDQPVQLQWNLGINYFLWRD